MTHDISLTHRLLKGDLAIIFYFSLFKLVLHFVVNATGGYGFFRDEFYYIACSQNLAAGYVDQPPLCAFILRGVTAIFGDSLFVVRLVPAFAGAISIFFTGLIAVRLGGGRIATFVACMLCFSGINLAMSGFYSMNSLDIMCWIIVSYVVIRIIQNEDKKWWIVLGLVLGLGLFNKVGVLFLGAGIFVGLIATSQRKWFTTPWPYVAGVIAFVCFLPYIVWNIQNDLAHLEFIRNASGEKYASLSALDFLVGQLTINNPAAILVWLPGLIALFWSKPMKPYRILGWMYVVPLFIFVMNGTSKSEYLAPAYGTLFAAGGVFWERQVSLGRRWRYALYTILAVWMAFTVMVLPMVLPILPVEKYVQYSNALGLEAPSPEGKEQAELPQFYADMFGWKEKAEGVAAVYNSLPEKERMKCAIFASNYGRCAAIDYYGKDLGLPKTIGSHNNYWIWGPRGYTGEVLIILGGELEEHAPNFEEVYAAGVVDCTYCMPYEDNLTVFVCKGLKWDINQVWGAEKHYD